MNKEGSTQRVEVEKIVEGMTLFDDTLMSMAFDDNIPATERMLKIILGRDDIEVVSVTGQKELQSPIVSGHTVQLDILIRDSSNKMYNVEVQRQNSGASPKRARYHSSMLDSRMLVKGQDFNELKDSFVIFITEKDYFKKSEPIYTVDRYINETNTAFMDGSHIIYVNGNYKGEDAIGRMLRDFKCKNSEDAYYKEFANCLKYFKEVEGGHDTMCEAVERYARKVMIETSVEFGISKEIIIEKLCNKFMMTLKEAEEEYANYAMGN